MEELLYLIFVGSFVLLFYGLPIFLVWFYKWTNSFGIKDVKSELCRIVSLFKKKDSKKKILTLVCTLVFFLIVISLTAIWGIALSAPGNKEAKLMFLLSMPFIYPVFASLTLIILKRHFGCGFAIFTTLLLFVSVISIFIAVKYVEIFGLH